jgi:hypothetical protein
MVRTLPVPDGAHILTAQGCEDVEPDGEGRFYARVPVDWLKAALLHKGHATFIEVGHRGIAIDIVASIRPRVMTCWMTIIVCEWRGPNELRHACGNDTQLILHEVGCDHFKMVGAGCALAAVVPARLVERARRRKGFARIVRRGHRRYVVFVDLCDQPVPKSIPE